VSRFDARRRAAVSLVVWVVLLVAAPVASQERETTLPGRPGALPALYISFSALQVLDVHSTLRAVGNGGREANPWFGGILEKPAGLVMLKVGTSLGVIYLNEVLWKRHRAAAIITMIGLNSAYVTVVARNYSIARGPR
jgi:uncharacterized protein DUF5658